MENKTNWWKVGAIIVGIIAVLILGIYIGKKITKPKIIERIEYITLPPQNDSVPPVIIKETVDTAKLIKQCVRDGIYQELFPEKIVYITDTLEFDKTDSTKVMQDWATKREYEATLFDSDTLGKCDIKTTVQYNRLGNINYTFTPMQKQVTTTEVVTRKFLPYIGGGITTYPSAEIEAGMFIDQSYGFALSGSYYFNPRGTENIQGIPKYSVGLKVFKMF